MIKENQITEHREWLGKQIVDIAYHIHKTLGPGLLESIYKSCFCYELHKRQILFVTQKKIPIFYDNIEFKEGLRLDLLVEDLIIIELKSKGKING